MPTKLYASATDTISDADKKSLAACERWLRRQTRKPSGTSCDGRQIADNIRDESHLCEGGDPPDPQLLAGFLKDWCARHAAAKRDRERCDCFSLVCKTYAARGKPIPVDHLPPGLLRYTTSRAAVAQMVERILGKVARKQFETGAMSAEDAFARMAVAWDSNRLTDRGRLARPSDSFTWATFEHVPGTPRDNARGMADALAHPVLITLTASSDEILYELSYPRDAVRDHRFPTIADAEWFHLFKPAPECKPDVAKPETCWGWTRSQNGQPAQPEIMHSNEPLGVLDAPPRFLGRLS